VQLQLRVPKGRAARVHPAFRWMPGGQFAAPGCSPVDLVEEIRQLLHCQSAVPGHLHIYRFRCSNNRVPDSRLLIVAVVLFIVVAQERGILSAPQILLKTAFTLWVHITLSSNETEKDREENEGMCRGPQNESDPHAEVVDFEDLES
jgi:hypothetical protein